MSTSQRKYRVLYFIRGLRPSDEEFEQSLQYGPWCGFRNVLAMDMAGSLEECDGVAGAVPARYGAAYPHAMPIAEFYAKQGRVSTQRGSVSGRQSPVGALPADPFLKPSAATAGSANWQGQG